MLKFYMIESTVETSTTQATDTIDRVYSVLDEMRDFFTGLDTNNPVHVAIIVVISIVSAGVLACTVSCGIRCHKCIHNTCSCDK